jgi:hypothetical protein
MYFNADQLLAERQALYGIWIASKLPTKGTLLIFFPQIPVYADKCLLARTQTYSRYQAQAVAVVALGGKGTKRLR